MVAGTKIALIFALDAQAGSAGKQQDPFVMVLTIGFIRRRALTGRHDPLDPHARQRQHLAEDLPVRARRKIIEEIDHALIQVED